MLYLDFGGFLQQMLGKHILTTGGKGFIWRHYLLAFQSVKSSHSSGVQLDGVSNIREHLFKGVRRFLIEENPNRFARPDATANHRDQFGSDEFLGFPL